MSYAPRPQRKPAAPPLATVEEAAVLADRLAETMDTLLRILEEETRLVREHRLGEAGALAASKAELANRYLIDIERVKATGRRLSDLIPDRVEGLKRRHGEFQSLVQINMAVLATAHAVAESLVRGVATDMAKRQRPATYGAGGRPVETRKPASAPMVISRKS
jgi:hypothetical protein